MAVSWNYEFHYSINNCHVSMEVQNICEWEWKRGEKRKEIALNNNVACFYMFWLHFPLHFVFFSKLWKLCSKWRCSNPNNYYPYAFYFSTLYFQECNFPFHQTIKHVVACLQCSVLLHCAMAKDSKLFTIVVQWYIC